MSGKWIEFEDHILDFATDELLPLMRPWPDGSLQVDKADDVDWNGA